MIDYRSLIFTLLLLLAIVGLTTVAAILNKIYSKRTRSSASSRTCGSGSCSCARRRGSARRSPGS